MHVRVANFKHFLRKRKQTKNNAGDTSEWFHLFCRSQCRSARAQTQGFFFIDYWGVGTASYWTELFQTRENPAPTHKEYWASLTQHSNLIRFIWIHSRLHEILVKRWQTKQLQRTALQVEPATPAKTHARMHVNIWKNLRALLRLSSAVTKVKMLYISMTSISEHAMAWTRER